MIKDDGSFFLTCHLQDPGQFKSDCSGRQVLGTLTVTSVWYFLELQSYHLSMHTNHLGDVPGGSEVKNPPASPGHTETWVQSLGREDSLEKIMATHSFIFAWIIPWIEEPGRL